MKPKIIDLFSGIGGLSLGAARADFSVALSVDIDITLLRVHEINFPRAVHLQADVAKVKGDELLNAASVKVGQLAGLVGGSPCQGFSRIGKRNVGDERNGLFVHFFRLVAETMPAFFLAENVPGILDEQNRKLTKLALAHLPSRYKLLEPILLKASEFGAATSRERVFFIGYLPERMDDVLPEEFEALKWSRETTVQSALAGLPRKVRDTWTLDEHGWRPLRQKLNGRFWDKIYRGVPENVGDPETVRRFKNDNLVSGCIATIHASDVQKRFAAVPEGGVDPVSRMPKLKRDGLCPTLRAGTGVDKGSFQSLRPIHYSEPRVITPREAARLQGFPDWFRFDRTKWHAFRGIGNSVSPFVAESLFNVLRPKVRERPGSK